MARKPPTSGKKVPEQAAPQAPEAPDPGDSAQFSPRAELRERIEREGQDNVYLEVWRERPGERDPEFCHEYPAAGWDIGVLLTDFGPGTYACTLRRRQGHGYIMRRTIVLTGAPKAGAGPVAPAAAPAPAPAVNAADPSNLFSMALTMMMNAQTTQQNLITALMNQRTGPQADPVAAGLSLYNTIAAAVRESKGAGDPAPADDDDTLSRMLRPVLTPIATSIGEGIRARMAAPPAGAAAPQPATARPPLPAPVPPAAPAPDNADAAVWTTIGVLLMRGAASDGDPGAYADVLIDVAGEHAARELCAAHPGPALAAWIAGQLPTMAPHRAWLDAVCANVAESFPGPGDNGVANGTDVQPAGADGGAVVG